MPELRLELPTKLAPVIVLAHVQQTIEARLRRMKGGTAVTFRKARAEGRRRTERRISLVNRVVTRMLQA